MELTTTVLFAKTVSKTLHHFSCKAHTVCTMEEEISDHRSDLSFDLNFVLLSPVVHCPHRNSVYSTALSQKLENNFLPLANIVFGLCGTTEKANTAFHLLLHLHVNMKVNRSVHNTEKMSS